MKIQTKKAIIGFLVWAGTVGTLVLGSLISLDVYTRIDTWEGNTEGSFIPLITGLAVFFLFVLLLSYLYSRFVIVPYEEFNDDEEI